MLSNELVSKYYVMDPSVEKSLFGQDLIDGMIVLVEHPNYKFELEDVSLKPVSLDYERNIANRWCKISEITEGYEGMMHFLATYGDGTSFRRSSAKYQGWIAKADNKLYDVIHGLVFRAFSGSTRERICLPIVEQAADKLVGLTDGHAVTMEGATQYLIGEIVAQETPSMAMNVRHASLELYTKLTAAHAD